MEKMGRIILTGASGFIGKWLVRELLENNIAVTIIVRDGRKISHDIKSNPLCTIIEGDISKLSPSDFHEEEYDAFIHLAWGGVAPENKNDVLLQLNNINMSIAAIELASDIGCKKFLAAGSTSEYALSRGVIDVDKEQSPNDFYGAAKVSAQTFLRVRGRQLGMPFIWMIIPSTFGPGRCDNNIITYTIRTLLERRIPSYGSLEQQWDFLYVKDVVRAIRLIAEKGIADKIYGIGSGEYRPLRNYIEEIRDIIDPELKLGIGDKPLMSSRSFSSCVDNRDLINDTGFCQQYSFEDGIKQTIQFFSMEKQEGIMQ